MSSHRARLAALCLLASVSLARSQGVEPVFEAGPARPLALSPDGSTLFAVNSPDHHLEVFDVTTTGLALRASVPVGLEPVAVSARSATEVWVVNHLSDSVSVVDVASVPPRVKRTLYVGDEPSDVVFAGPGRRRAFVTAAHRGQNDRVPPQPFTPGIGRADVWVFDADNPGADPGGDPMAVVTLFGDTPRALAVSPDGSTIYAAIFHSGNRTAIVPQGAVPNGSMPPPTTNVDGVPAPPTGLIVKYDGAHWRDPLGRSWDDAIRFSLPDKDVFAIDANATPPREIASWAGVGTVLFGMAVNPATGRLYVSNTEARNDVRFEGTGSYAGSTVRGHVVENRITVVDATGVRPRHLNGHINYGVTPGTPRERARSLAQPMGMAVTSDGSMLYLAAFSSRKIAIVPTSSLEAGTYVPTLSASIPVAGGPSGLVLDEARSRLYVLSRFDNLVSAVHLPDGTFLARIALHSNESPAVVAGRKLFYDAASSSGHGDASCASCHVFGDNDDLAWDLGNPEKSISPNPNPFRFPPSFNPPPFHPMKGPMTTQTLRSLSGHGPLHWRGDRTGGNDPGGSPLDTRAGLMQFAGAFDSLLGRGAPLDPASMSTMADFILRLTAPPNPVRNLDNSLTAAQARGQGIFRTVSTTGAGPCLACHTTDPSKSEYGADGMSSFDGFPQMFKIASQRSIYTKVGMFGMPPDPLFRTGNNGFMGDQIRGFGYSFDGSVDTLERFLSARVFNFPLGDGQRQDVAEFLIAFDADQAPIVGQEVTRSSDNPAAADPRIDLLIARAAVTSPRAECDLIVKGVVSGQSRGWVRTASGLFRSDRASEPPVADRDLRALAATPGQSLTYTAVPPGTGTRLGIDRDLDGYLDADELDAHSDPANAASTPLDRDGDGVPNSSDCAPDDAGSFGVPVEVAAVALAAVSGGGTQLTWTPQSATSGPATVYDVASGTLGDLESDRGFAHALCLDESAPGGGWLDSRGNPSPKTGFWYQVRATNACGAGTYGAGLSGAPRTITACP